MTTHIIDFAYIDEKNFPACSKAGGLLPQWPKNGKPKYVFFNGSVIRVRYPEPYIPSYEWDSDLKLTKAQKKQISRRISRAFLGMGLSYMHGVNLVKVTSSIPVAAWALTNTNKEVILINPRVALGKQAYVNKTIKHELMHRSLYRGSKHLKNKVLLNLVLDICINKVLATNNTFRINRQSWEWCRWLYPQESKRTLLALCNCALKQSEVNQLPKDIRDLWLELYGRKYGHETKPISNDWEENVTRILPGFAELKPISLYWRLLDDFNDSVAFKALTEGGANPFGTMESEVEGLAARSDFIDPVSDKEAERIDDAIKKSFLPKRQRRYNAGKQFSNAHTNWWETYGIEAQGSFDDGLKDFVKKLHTEKLIQDLVGKLIQELTDDDQINFAPINPTAEGVLFAILGISGDDFPYYFCQSGEATNKKRCLAFLDLSPSMQHLFPYVVRILDSIEDHTDVTFARNAEEGGTRDLNLVTFAGSIREVSLDEYHKMRGGELQMGASTCFTEVVKYCNEKISSDEIDIVLVFTDGESSCDPEQIAQFNKSGINMHKIYMQTDDHYKDGDIIESDLDECAGNSYTLILPRVEQ